MSRLMSLSLLSVALLASACSTPAKTDAKEATKPAVGSLTRTLDMVDQDGRHYGTVQLDPFGGGKIIDGDGRTVGTIVPPTAK